MSIADKMSWNLSSHVLPMEIQQPGKHKYCILYTKYNGILWHNSFDIWLW